MNIVDADWERASDTIETLGESPAWSPDEQALYWVDLRAPALFRLDPATGVTRQWPMPSLIGGVALAQHGRLIVALATGLVWFDPSTGAITPYLTLEPPEMNNRLNESKCDRRGRLWVGTMRDFGAATTGSLYRVAHGHAQRMLTDITIPNAHNWSPDNRTFYFADTRQGAVRAYAFDLERGELGAMRELVAPDALPGKPDGATVDAEGFLWVTRTGGGGIARVDPEGKVERFLRLPVSQPSSCAFGGRDLDVLYVTTSRQRLDEAALAREPLAGALLALRVGVKGLPETPFAG